MRVSFGISIPYLRKVLPHAERLSSQAAKAKMEFLLK